MNCKDVEAYIVNRQNMKRSDENVKAFKEHLVICPKCRDMFETISRLNELEKISPPWKPDNVYWYMMLPRVHIRLQEKKELILPSWLYRSMAPAAAALLIIILSVFLVKLNNTNRDIIPSDITSSEIANYIDEENIVNPYISNNNGIIDTLGSEDATVIRDLLKNEKNVASYYEDRAGAIFETVNDNEAEILFALLAENIDNK